MATGKDTRIDVRVQPAGDPNPGDVRVRGGEVTWSDVFLTSTAGADVVVDPDGSIVAPVAVESGPGTIEELTATSAGTSTGSAALTRARGLSVSSTGIAASSAAVTRARGLAGTTVGTSTTAGAVSEYENMAAVSAGGSVSDAGLARTLALTGVSAGSGVSATTGLGVDGPPRWSPAVSTPGVGVGDVAALQFMLRDSAQEEEMAAAYVAALVLL
jgi:hypothetical protein